MPYCIQSFTIEFVNTELGIYKRKQESKKTRKQELDQESDKEKEKVFLFFLFSCFLDLFLSRVLVFLLSCFLL